MGKNDIIEGERPLKNLYILLICCLIISVLSMSVLPGIIVFISIFLAGSYLFIKYKNYLEKSDYIVALIFAGLALFAAFFN